ncbi:MAG: hypothetical protein IPP64_06170 [Bacteroidetes bacterium]|nr:hypothetical protein [Bacteroidota bacterium]
MSKKTIITLFMWVSASITFAQIESYSFKRPINKIEKEDYYKVSLSPEITARCQSNLSDIRIYNIIEQDTTEAPYLLNWMGSNIQEVSIPFELINDTYNEKCCSYVTLKFPKKQSINQIKLNVSDSNFDKQLKIEGSDDTKQWFTIKEHLRIVRFRNASEDYSYTTLNFNRSEFTYFRIKFDDDGSPRINVTEAYAFENKLIEGKYDNLKITDTKQSENKKEKTSEIIVDFSFPYLVNYITLRNSSKNDFYRNINIYGSDGTIKTEKGELESWYIITTSVFSSLEDNIIFCNNSKTKKLKLEIINYDNEPIVIDEIKAFAEQCQLVAKLPVSKNLYLVYGKENDNSPKYDLVHFKDKIPNELSNADYGAEQIKVTLANNSEPLIKSKVWLWIAMGVVLVIIGYFALTMLKKEQSEKE